MQYSVLVRLNQLCRTLKDAAAYLEDHREGALSDTLRKQGAEMLSGMGNVLRSHPGDVPDRILKDLAGLEAAWGGAGLSPEAMDEFSAALVREVRYQVRAVFFAELGEKWDSMDSVYQFMRQDPRFDPVVVLMPIFRQIQGKDGTTKQETIYRDYLTPMGIPFMGYDEYSLPDELPDLAFTSQPYDGVQLPQFSAKYVSKYTRLVYLPYFLPGIVSDQCVTALCRLPIYEYAWKVIGASQKHYEFYRRHSLREGLNMIVSGIPKLDPLVRLRREGVPLPPGWREKLEGRRVILWNSWYDMGANSLRYFEDILGWFREHPDCALIWRPHPMTDSVTKLYWPDQYETWTSCRQRLTELPNAVQDRERSFEAAFYYSHAQISDFSSLIDQYLLCDKPLLWIQDPSWNYIGELTSNQWTEKASDFAGIRKFLEDVRAGVDRNAGLRKDILRRDLPLADGMSGRRVCEWLYSAMHMEDGVLPDGARQYNLQGSV